jgi:hypothetical protein
MASSITSKNAHANARPANRGEAGQPATELNPGKDMIDYFREYAREKPEVVALWCLGIGFVLGWKLKPW